MPRPAAEKPPSAIGEGESVTPKEPEADDSVKAARKKPQARRRTSWTRVKGRRRKSVSGEDSGSGKEAKERTRSRSPRKRPQQRRLNSSGRGTRRRSGSGSARRARTPRRKPQARRRKSSGRRRSSSSSCSRCRAARRNPRARRGSRSTGQRSRSRSSRPRSKAGKRKPAKSTDTEKRSRRAPKTPRGSSEPAKKIHLTYDVMVAEAIQSLDEDKGSCLANVVMYIERKFKPTEPAAKVDQHVKHALVKGVKNGVLIQLKGTGWKGFFRIAPNDDGKKRGAKAANPTPEAPTEPKRSTTQLKTSEEPPKAKKRGRPRKNPPKSKPTTPKTSYTTLKQIVTGIQVDKAKKTPKKVAPRKNAEVIQKVVRSLKKAVTKKSCRPLVKLVGSAGQLSGAADTGRGSDDSDDEPNGPCAGDGSYDA